MKRNENCKIITGNRSFFIVGIVDGVSNDIGADYAPEMYGMGFERPKWFKEA